MNILRFILIAVEIVSCLMLVGVILLQQSKSGGMGTAFGGGMGETMFGARAGNVLTKITITLAIVFLANTTLLGIIYTSKDEGSIVDSAAIPSAVPGSGPIAGANQVPPPSQQQGTLFTADEAPAQPAAIDAEPVSLAPAAEESIVVEQDTVPANP